MVAQEESTVRAVRRTIPTSGPVAAIWAVLPIEKIDFGIREAIRSVDRTTFLACCLLAFLFALRCTLAVQLPLAFDEAYYWLWSKHLALGYFEHPADIALAIRAGTGVFGDTEWGVRAVSVILSLVASAAVWRSAALLLSSERLGAIACLLFNSTLMVSAETMGATPDSLLIVSAALLLWTIAKLEVSNDGRLWLATGTAAGLAISAKYTGFFLCGSLALWLLANARARAWLRTPWPYTGALIAVVFFIPTLYWNAMHDFASFAFQFRRIGNPGAGHILEFAGGQLALASPFVLVLAGFGLARSPLFGRNRRALAFAAAIVWPALLFFALHAFHDRVQGNWPCFVYPSLALLAASAFAKSSGVQCGSIERISRALVFPVALLILGLAYGQAFFGVFPIGTRDPIARMTAIGFAPVARLIAADASRIGARAILTTNYSMTGWLAFYAHTSVDIVQIVDERRFLSSPPADRDALSGTVLYVTARPDRELPAVREHFSQVSALKTLDRTRNGNWVSSVYLFTVSGFHGATAGRVPWPDRSAVPRP